MAVKAASSSKARSAQQLYDSHIERKEKELEPKLRMQRWAIGQGVRLDPTVGDTEQAIEAETQHKLDEVAVLYRTENVGWKEERKPLVKALRQRLGYETLFLDKAQPNGAQLPRNICLQIAELNNKTNPSWDGPLRPRPKAQGTTKAPR